ncbi:pyrroloquinoline quinone biosynthesis peptide chaperone PqqD [Plastoroseomonas arctica]|uniref:PqqA binding protein n=1 Tax=Plastoroseomonas arctica TaxID=1509237 RepID=A0AAF1KLX4_9PROT|nr:pyrroloquinoline quinone biosynthesis peptide chaperone PqqD [Plastoroseomonas arctica]MBR0655331.1 pyrroloquinoline quinone biosynthesis peptide chaperone PqqD [Plastoroseomonas arctica]
MSLTEASAPRLARGYRLRRDAARDRMVVLGPERVFEADETALAILALIDGERSVAEIIDALAAQYAAPRSEIAGDVLEMLADLAERGVIAP